MKIDQGWPKLQIALDFVDLDKALKTAELAFSGGCEWIEAGTPLIKSVGIEAVKKLKQQFPDAKVVADMKTLDAGSLEVELAAKAGADIVSISGLAHQNTILDSANTAHAHGLKLQVDLICVPDIPAYAKRAARYGADMICLHSGIDAESKKPTSIQCKISAVRSILQITKLPVSVAGGITPETAKSFAAIGTNVIVVGRTIVQSQDPAGMARHIRKIVLDNYKPRRSFLTGSSNM